MRRQALHKLYGLVLFAALLGGCTRPPTEEELTPPDGWAAGFAEVAARAPEAVRGLPRATAKQAQAYLEQASPPPGSVAALTTAIKHSRAQAAMARQRRPPAHVREALEPYFGEEMLEEVRWVLPGRRLSIGSILAGWYFNEGAVTLDDIIVFSDEDLADNVWFWAHELGHVEQYRRYGISGFASRYVADWRAMEAGATERANTVTAMIKQSREAEALRRAKLVEAIVPGISEPGVDRAENADGGDSGEDGRQAGS